MSEREKIYIQVVKGSKRDYIIKDSTYITIGRFTILELDTENKKSSIRLKFYREDNFKLLIESLECMLKVIFNKKDIYKVNIFTNEAININAFLDLGFVLEGILSDNIFFNGSQRNELIFGINVYDFKEKVKVVQFRIPTRRVELVNLNPANAEEVLEYFKRNEEHLKAFEPSRDNSFYTIDVQQDILMESYKQFIDGTTLDLGIFKEGKLVGKIKLSNIVYGVFKSAFIGYSIDKDYQGKGYMKEAVSAVCDYAFNEMGLHRLEASTLVDNEKSQSVLKACGFKTLGINEKYLYINGQWRDHVTFYKVK